MIGLRAIASYVPDGFEENSGKMGRFNIDARFIADKIGVGRVARKGDDEETSDMCVCAYHALREKTGVTKDDVDCLIVCTQNPDGHGIPHTSTIVQAKLDLPESCATFDISLGCSGYVYGLSIAKSFMEANGLSCGLLFTCDPYSKILDPDDKNTVLLFGDAAAVSLMTGDAPDIWRPTAFRFNSLGKQAGALHNDGGKLSMNGRAVFNFSATTVPSEISAFLKISGLKLADIDLFCFHQASKYLLDTLCERLDLPKSKVPTKMFDFGNTVSSSIPLLLEDYLEDPKVHRMLLCGFGVGLSVATCVIERQEDG